MRWLAGVLLLALAVSVAASSASWPLELTTDGLSLVMLSVGSPGRRVKVLLNPASSVIVADAITLGIDQDAEPSPGLLIDLGGGTPTWFPARTPISGAEFGAMSTLVVSVILGLGAQSPFWIHTRCVFFAPGTWTIHSGRCTENRGVVVPCNSSTLADLLLLCPAPDGGDVMVHLPELLFRGEVTYDAQRTLGLRAARVVDELPFIHALLTLALIVALAIWTYDIRPTFRRSAGLLGLAGAVAAATFVVMGGRGADLDTLDTLDPPPWLPVGLYGVGTAPESVWNEPWGLRLLLPGAVVAAAYGGALLCLVFQLSTEADSIASTGVDVALWAGPWLLQADSARGDWLTLLPASLALLATLLACLSAWRKPTALRIIIALTTTALIFVFVLHPLISIAVAPRVVVSWSLSAFIVLLLLWAAVATAYARRKM